MMQNILIGIQACFQWQNILVIVAGTIAGITFGALPGFTASMGVAVLLPVTFGLSPVTGLCLLGGIYCGAIYGGSITACLVNTPGTPAAAATAKDGFEMTRNGHAGEALRESAVASFWGGIISALALLFIAPPLAKFALKFQPPEMFMLGVFGLTIIVSLSSGSLLKGFISGILGLLAGTIGMESKMGYPRFAFGQPTLYGGVTLVPALIGLFSASQVYTLIADGEDGIVDVNVENVDVGRPSLKDFFMYPIVYLRSGLIGTFVGAVPAAGANVAAFMGYNEGKRFSKNPELFGKGSREAVASAEAANNGVTGGSLITMLTLGVPGNSTTAILMGGLMIHGLNPGWNLFSREIETSYGFMISLFIANFVFLMIGVFCAKYFANIAKTPVNVLCTMIVLLGVMGSFAIGNDVFDVWIMFIFGLLGFLLKRSQFDLSPIVLGLILGPIAENGLNQSVIIAMAKKTTVAGLIFQRPICLVLLIMCIASIATPIVKDVVLPAMKKRKAAKCEQ